MVTTDEARRIADQYDSLPELRLFAGGSEVLSYESFMQQVAMITNEYGFDAFEDAVKLSTWADNTTDAVWEYW